MGGDTLSKRQRSNTMSAVLARPRHSAPLRLHLNHFLKFVIQTGSRVNGHKVLLSETSVVPCQESGVSKSSKNGVFL